MVGITWGVDEINELTQPVQDRVLKEMQLDSVLVIDDEPDMQLALRHALKKNGCDVQSRNCLRSAVDQNQSS